MNEARRAANIRRASRHLWKYRPRWEFRPCPTLAALLAEIEDDDDRGDGTAPADREAAGRD